MKTIRPRALRRGDVIGICSPASAPASEEALERGIRYLEGLGYRIELGKNVYLKRGYLAGTDAQRAADLNELFGNRKVRAIIAARGGYGSHRVLPLLNYRTIRQNPKILVGYSDITALQLGLMARTGLVTFSGPMVASELSSGLRGKSEEWFWRCVTSTKRLPTLHTGRARKRRPNSVGAGTGRLIGGNLAVVASSVGTPFFPDISPAVLLLEEIDERPYRVDRMLRQIRLAGILSKARGVALGAFVGCTPDRGKPSLTLRQIFDETFGDIGCPVIRGLPYGHVKNFLTMPLGIRVRVDAGTGGMAFLQSAVS
jgi:muramoyltetrapeptide carboxypeptidase